MIKEVLKAFVLTASLLVGGSSSLLAQDNVVDQVVWLVGDEPILLSDIEYQKIRMRSEGRSIEGNLDCLIPEQIAVEKLFLNQAKIDSITANEALVSRELESRVNYFIGQFGSKEKLEEYFNKPFKGIREDLLKSIRNGSIVGDMQRKITANVSVSPSEIRNFYNELPKDSLPFIPQTVEVQLISLEPRVDIKEIDRIKDKLRQFREDIKSGEKSFENIARLYSEDRKTAMQGGAYGFVGKASLEPKFADVVFNLKDKDQVSQVVQTEEGYHLVQLIEKRGDLVNFRHILLRPTANEEAIVKATERMDSIVNLIDEDKMTFSIAAQYYSEDKESFNNGGLMTNTSNESKFFGSASFRYEDLPQDIAKVVYTLKEGEMSKPFIYRQNNGRELVALVKLKAVHPEHLANLNTDYQTIQEFALAKKRNLEIDKWIRRKQKETPIVIKVHYKDCDFRYPGWGQKAK